MTNGFRIGDGGGLIVEINSVTSSSAGVISKGEYQLNATSDGAGLDSWNAADDADVYLITNRTHFVEGDSVNVLGGGNSGVLTVNLGTTNSSCQFAGDLVAVNTTDEANGNKLETAGQESFVNFNNSSNNSYLSQSKQAQFVTGDKSSHNSFYGTGNVNHAYISGFQNSVIVDGLQNEVNVNENAESTTVYGSTKGETVLNNKAGGGNSTTLGNTLFMGRGGKAKINDFGLNLLANIINCNSSEVHTSGINAAIFEKLNYEKDGVSYNWDDYLNIHEQLKTKGLWDK